MRGRRSRHGGRAGRDVRLPGTGAAAAGAARAARPHPTARGAPQPQQHAGGRAGSVLRGEGGAAAGGRCPARAGPPQPLSAVLPSPQACFASLVSQDYVNGTDQEEIRTGEPGAGAGRPPFPVERCWGQWQERNPPGNARGLGGRAGLHRRALKCVSSSREVMWCTGTLSEALTGNGKGQARQLSSGALGLE